MMPRLSRMRAAALSATGCDTVVLHVGPLTGGAPDHAPYDAIIVQGGVEQFPDTLAEPVARRRARRVSVHRGALGVAASA